MSQRAITIPRCKLGDGHILDIWIPDFFNRVMGSVFLDSDKSVVVAMKVYKRLLELASMHDLIPPEDLDPFRGVHPNQWFVSHCLRIGKDVEYRVQDQGSSAEASKRFRCTTLISNVVMSVGYGSSNGASRTANFERMRSEPYLLDYCNQLRAAFGQAHTSFHSLERFSIPSEPMAVITDFHCCPRKEIEKWLSTLQLTPDEVTTKRGVKIVVPRIMSVLVYHHAVESISVGPTIQAANQTTLERYSASLSRSIPMATFIKFDYALLRPDILAAVSMYYPRIPFPLEVVRPYLPSTHKDSLVAVPSTLVDNPSHFDNPLPASLLSKRKKVDE